MTRHFQNDV